jgi:hypothetical protein
MIYADAADAKKSSLLGVIIMDAKSGKKKIITAESAVVNFDNPAGRFSEVKVFAKNAFQFDDQGGAFTTAVSVTGQFETMMQDNIKFQKIEQINAIKASPILYYPIALTAWNAYERITIELLADEVKKSITAPKDNLFQLYSKDKLLKITGKSCSLVSGQNAVEVAGDVNLFEYDKNSGELLKSYHGEKLTLQLSGDTEKRPSNVLILTFPNAIWLDRGIEYIKPRFTAQDISLPSSVTAKLGEDIIATVKEHKYVSQPSKQLEAMIKEVSRKIRVTLFEIKAEIHSRLVFGIGCITLIIIGIGLGIRFRGGHLLTAFGVSSIPAAALLVFIMMGKNITKSQPTDLRADIGIGVMWFGLIVLTMFALMLYRRLLRN